MNTPLTPEQERFARAVLEMPDFPATVVETMLAAALDTIDALRKDHDFMGRALDTMHEINARLEVDARRWHAVRDGLFVERWYDERGWILGTKGTVQKNPAPATQDAAADPLAAEQEARNG